jgi:hypothetical protein
MSDLLKKKTTSKLDRGQQIQPSTLFNLEREKPIAEKKSEMPIRSKHKNESDKTTTVRVSTSTKNRLNALVTLGVAETVDQLIDILLEEYTTNILSKDEKKQLDLIFDLYRSKKK